MIEKIRIVDFSPVPFGRYPTDGNFSGQRFRREKLRGPFNNNDIERVEVDFNGIVPVGSSFLDESFGGMTLEQVWRKLKIISDFPLYAIQIENILKEAESEVKG